MEKHFKIVEIPVVARLQSKYNEVAEQPIVEAVTHIGEIQTQIGKIPYVKSVQHSHYVGDGGEMEITGQDGVVYTVTIKRK